jgi:hypothetical protein
MDTPTDAVILNSSYYSFHTPSLVKSHVSIFCDVTWFANVFQKDTVLTHKTGDSSQYIIFSVSVLIHFL